METNDVLRVNIDGEYDPPKRHTLGDISDVVANMALEKVYAAQQGVQLTALRRVLAVSICINVVLLAVVLFTIGGN